jgi:hypothetical protein
VNEKNNILRIVSKVALLLVVLGFFMPVCCGSSGFQLANHAINLGSQGIGIALY